MIGSAADISFNAFVIRMGPPVAVVWLAVLLYLKFAFRKELAVKPADTSFHEKGEIKDPKLWRASLIILGVMVALFILHDHGRGRTLQRGVPDVTTVTAPRGLRGP